MYFIPSNELDLIAGKMSVTKALGPITPLPLQRNALVWYSAQNESYTNNASVPTIHDWSGNGKHATANTAGTFNTTGMNGLPSFTFASDAYYSIRDDTVGNLILDFLLQ